MLMSNLHNLCSIALAFLVGPSSIIAENNCSCGYYKDLVGPYCSSWVKGYQPYCFLAGRSAAKNCTGAVKYGDTDFYWTMDKDICEKSSNYSLEHCKCGYYEKYDLVKPYCDNWIPNYPPFCFLAEYPETLFCPGAVKEEDNVYSTTDKGICNKSTPQVLKLSLKRLYTTVEIIQLCVYAFTMLIGTIGNALVVKSFASENVLGRPGSRFVIVLGVIDFISSVWIPGLMIIDTIYANPRAFNYWPFGEITCRILYFYPFLTYATPWLLVAISVERARAIYRPFTERPRTKIVLFISAILVAVSFALTLKMGLSVKYSSNVSIIINNQAYEYPRCAYRMSNKEAIIDFSISKSLGIWFPMLIIFLVHIMMYVRLKNRALTRQGTSSHDYQGQLSRISRTFTTILVTFYICYLPTSIQHMILLCDKYFKKEIVDPDIYNHALTITNLLLFCNSSMNPIIYSKIHLKIYSSIRKIIATCKASCTISIRCCQNQSLKQETDNLEEPLTQSTVQCCQIQSLKLQRVPLEEPLTQLTSQTNDQKPCGNTSVHFAPEKYDVSQIKQLLLDTKETPV